MATKTTEKTLVGTGIPHWQDSERAQTCFKARAKLMEEEAAIKAQIDSLVAQIAHKQRTIALEGWGGDNLEAAVARDECKVLDAEATDLRRKLLELRKAHMVMEQRIAVDLEESIATEQRQLHAHYLKAMQGMIDALWTASQWANRAAMLYRQAQDDLGIDIDPSEPRHWLNANIEPLHWHDLRSHIFYTDWNSDGPIQQRRDTRLENWLRNVKEAFPQIKLPDDFEE